MDKKNLRALALGLGLSIVVSSSGVYAGPSPKDQVPKLKLASQTYLSSQDLLKKTSREEMKKPGGHFVVGQLDKSPGESLIVYEQRDINQEDDPGYLVSYKMDKSSWVETSRLSMDYANTVLEMKIAKGFGGENILYVVSSQGAHGSSIALYKMENGKLVSLINRKKMITTSQLKAPEIKDIDGDGIYEFSLDQIDENLSQEEDLKTMTLWYRYDGQDSAQLVRLDRQVPRPSEKLGLYRELLEKKDYGPAYKFLKDRQAELSRIEMDQGLRGYLLGLEADLADDNLELISLVEEAKVLANTKDLDLLNRPADFSQSNLFGQNPKLRDYILKSQAKGYGFKMAEGSYYLVIDYTRLEGFKEKLSPELSDYIGLMDLETRKNALVEETMVISMEEMAKRIGDLEKFRLIYPYSEFMDQVNQYHRWNIRGYLFSTYNRETKKLRPGVRASYEKALRDYDYLPLADILEEYLGYLDQEGSFNQTSINRMNQVLVEDELLYGLKVLEKLSPGSGVDKINISYIASEIIANEKIEKAVKDYFSYKQGEDGALAYYYNYVDLNNDSKDEIIVYLLGDLVAGSGGSTALVLSPDYRVISKIGLVRNPIVVSPKTSHGYRDLIINYSGGGGPSGYGVLAFNGKTYPENPSTAPGLDSTKLEGLGLVANQVNMETALKIR